MTRQVLVIDDDPGARTLLRALFEHYGAAVEVAQDGETGLRKLQEREYDAILLDLMMPGLDGFELVRRISPEVSQKVIVLTAMAERAMTRLDASAVWKVIRKPFDISEVIREVNEVCAVSQ
jgi:two-component system response regulator ResD